MHAVECFSYQECTDFPNAGSAWLVKAVLVGEQAAGSTDSSLIRQRQILQNYIYNSISILEPNLRMDPKLAPVVGCVSGMMAGTHHTNPHIVCPKLRQGVGQGIE